jgi:tetratricopeptide (TPR) repeat protein
LYNAFLFAAETCDLLYLQTVQATWATDFMRDTKFWTWVLAFQVVFGLAIFAVTRNYYMQETEAGSIPTASTSQPAMQLPAGISQSDITGLGLPRFDESIAQDPADISRQADELFANQQYAPAAALYEQLLTFGPNNAEIHNNLGLTLHYLGRSDEALLRLNEGTAVDPEHQRIWLTLGYVNSQMGNIEQARSALTTATQIGDNESIRQSAMTMLENLPE